jgi:hypothetical protein
MRKILASVLAGAMLVAACSPTSTVDEGGGGGNTNTPDHLTVTVQPTLVDVGTAMAPALRVEVRDAGNSRVDSSAVEEITVSITPGSGTVGGATVSGTTTRPVVDGVATFNDLTFSEEGTGFTLTFTAVGVTDAVSNAFNVTDNANYIYFSSTRSGSWEVWRMREDGSVQGQVTTRAMLSDPTPSKNPTNGVVAFSDGATGIQSLYTILGADGSGLRHIQTRSDAGETSWSPTGKTIASRVAAGAPSFGLFSINGDGTNRQQLGGGIQDFPSWSPEGDEIAFTKNYLDLMVMPSTGGDGKEILKHDTLSTGEGVLVTAAGDSFPGFTNSAAAFVPFTYLQTAILHTAWSPDGMRIAFELEAVDGVAHIFAISNLGGGTLVALTNHATASDRSPSWSPDGTKIFFQSNRSGTWQIWSMNANGTGLTQLTSTGQNYSPSWWN